MLRDKSLDFTRDKRGISRIVIILITAIVFAGLAGAGVWWWQNQQFQKQKQDSDKKIQELQKQIEDLKKEDSKTQEDSESKESELKSLDNTWNLYTNYKLGFSLKVPKKSFNTYGGCEWTTKDGDHSYRPKGAFVPVKVFEDDEQVIIATEYLYVLSGETKEDYKSFFSKCNKVTTTLTKLEDKDDTYFYSPSWHINIKEVKNDQELDKVIKDNYGSGCSIGNKKSSKQEGVFDVEIKGDGKDLGSTKCPVNFALEMKYYPAKNKLAFWNIGQAHNFYKADFKDGFDSEMSDSFKFLTN